MPRQILNILIPVFCLIAGLSLPAQAETTRERDVNYYTHVQVADCTGEQVEFRTRAVTRTVTRSGNDGSSSTDYVISLQSLGKSLSSRTRYVGYERARVLNRSYADGSSSLRVSIIIRYYASHGERDLKGKIEYYVVTDADGTSTVLVDNQSLQCV
jgi:hypothetical protein